MTTEPNEPISPCLLQRVADGPNGLRANKPSDPKEWNVPMSGLSKREYFAAMAMQGILSNPSTPQKVITDEIGLLGIASFACKSADALIEALNKQ